MQDFQQIKLHKSVESYIWPSSGVINTTSNNLKASAPSMEYQ